MALPHTSPGLLPGAMARRQPTHPSPRRRRGGRVVTARRISFTDRRNCRRVSGMPALGGRFPPGAERLTNDESPRQTLRSGIWREPWGHGLAGRDRATNGGLSQIGG